MDALTDGEAVRERPPSAPTPAGASRDEAAALLILLRLPGVGDYTAARLVERFGSGVAALAAPRPAFADLAGTPAANAREDGERRERVERALDWCAREGVAVGVRGRAGYPAALEDLVDPPAVVLLRGRTELLDRPSVGVVGSRKSTASGRRTAGALASALAGVGVTTVSGLALGIDAAAHRGALDAGGPTVAVLGTGPDAGYPPSNRGLFRRIAEEGLLVTEFLPGEPARPYHFPRRNRVLAALSGVIVVVEAAARSGALVTAGHALDLGRSVAAVPGSVYAPQSVGANRLIQDGAQVILEPDDLLALVDGMPPLAPPAPQGPRPSGAATAPEPPAETAEEAPGPSGPAGAVWSALGATARTVDALAAATSLAPEVVLASLSELELAGRAVREPGGRFRRA